MGYDESLLLDHDGRVIECTAANIFALRANELITPKLSKAGVAGVMRDFILTEVADSLGLSVSESIIELPELFEAEALFVSSAIRGVSPVSELVSEQRQHQWGVNERVKKIQQKIFDSMIHGMKIQQV